VYRLPCPANQGKISMAGAGVDPFRSSLLNLGTKEAALLLRVTSLAEWLYCFVYRTSNVIHPPGDFHGPWGIPGGRQAYCPALNSLSSLKSTMLPSNM